MDQAPKKRWWSRNGDVAIVSLMLLNTVISVCVMLGTGVILGKRSR